jgi:hypothetical protein
MNLPFGGEDILKVEPTPNITNPKPGTPYYDNALARARSSRSIEAMPWLPQDPTDEWAKELYERIEEAERTYAAPNLRYKEYIAGTAKYPDEIATVKGKKVVEPYLFTAEHATSPVVVSTGVYRSPDAGTGGLAAVMAEDYGTAFIMRGRQTTNVPSSAEHPIRPLILEELTRSIGFMSVHGMFPRKFVRQSDRVEIQACIGLGINPTEPMRDFARKIVLGAQDLGLYAVISNDQPAYIQQRQGTRLKRQEDGTVKLSQLAAVKSPKMTVNYSRNRLREIGRNIPSLQMELTNLLLLTTSEGVRKDKKSRIIGVALGYKLLEKVVQLTFQEVGPETDTLV